MENEKKEENIVYVNAGSRTILPGYVLELTSASDSDVIVTPGGAKNIRTGVHVDIRDKGVFGIVTPARPNDYDVNVRYIWGPTIITSEDKGEVCVPIGNYPFDGKQISTVIRPGEVIAKVVFVRAESFSGIN